MMVNKKGLDDKDINELMVPFGMDIAIKKELYKYMEIHQFNEGEMIWRMDEDHKYFYYLVKGRALVHMTSKKGKELYLDFCKPPEIFGEMEFMTKSRVHFDVEALEDCTLLALPKKFIKLNGEGNLEFYRMISEYLGRKLSHLAEIYTSHLLYTVKERVADYIYRATSEVPVLKFSQKKLSLSLGITDRHLRRIIKELLDENILLRDGNDLVVIDREKLREYE